MSHNPLRRAIAFNLAVVMFLLPVFTTPQDAKALQYDQETGLYYNRARTYNPELGRFQQRDPHQTALILMTVMRENAKTPMALASIDIGGQYTDGMNLYQYAKSNPLLSSDPSGEFALLAALLIGGAIFGALGTAGVIHATAADDNMSRGKYWTAIGVGALVGVMFGLGLGVAGAIVGKLLGVSFATGTAYVTTMYGVNTFGRGAANRYLAEDDIEIAFANMEMAAGGMMTVGGAYAALRGVPMWRGGQGYRSFGAFKLAHGEAGPGQAWHHIVEQNPTNMANFRPEIIHSTNNLVRLPHGKGTIHQKIGDYYSTKPRFAGGLTVRQWLGKQSFAAQYKFGLETMRRFGVTE